MPRCLTGKLDEGMKGRKTEGVIALTPFGFMAVRSVSPAFKAQKHLGVNA
jgi:hypothetical protein